MDHPKKSQLQLNRRNFIKQSALVSFGFIALSRFSNDPTKISSNTKVTLKQDPNGYLNIPEGFSCRIISTMGEKMDDGFLVPGCADGIGAFVGKDGRVLLVCNHENIPSAFELGPFGKKNELLDNLDPALIYYYGQG